MRIGRVIGSIVSTKKYETFKGKKILVVEPLDEELKPVGEPIIALDAIGAGYKEIVFYVMAREATIPFGKTKVPSDATIVGIIDHVR
jgi:ethanolamine utilization protein EutN